MSALEEIRPQRDTVRRHTDPRSHPVAYAATAGVCSHGNPAEVDEPIFLTGSVVIAEPDGTRRVDLSGASWHPAQHCMEVSA